MSDEWGAERLQKAPSPAGRNLIKSFLQLGGRVYPVRHYPKAVRLRDREGRAILCIALYPRTGESSGAILGVRSVALLHTQSQLIIGAERQFRGRPEAYSLEDAPKALQDASL